MENEITAQENLPRGERLSCENGVLGEPLEGDLGLLVHELGKLEIEEGNLVSSEVACKGNLNSLSSISHSPFGMMIFLDAEFANFLAESLSFLKRSEGE